MTADATSASAPARAGRLAASWRGLLAGWSREVREMRRSPDRLMALVTAPMLTLVFLAIMVHAGRRDLAPFAVLAPALLVLWQMALQTSGDTVESERENGSLEALVATPTPLSAVIGGRIAAVTTVSLLGFVESWLVAGLVFGIWVQIVHPWLFVITVLATGYATSGSAIVLAALFVKTRAARALHNSLTYPFYVLGGVMVPVSYLPDWLEPVTRLVFLSWSSDLMRDSLTDAPAERIWLRLGCVLLLGTVGAVIGTVLIRRALVQVRQTGTIGHA